MSGGRPVRRALFVKGGDPFFGFGGFARFQVVTEGTIDVLFHGGGPKLFHQAFRIRECSGSALQNRGSDFLRFGFEFTRAGQRD